MTSRFELAGDRINVAETADGTSVFTFSEPGTGRVCGDCQLCCRLVPVPEIRKAAGARCMHARYGKGCTIHAHRPLSCRVWSCRWLADPDTAGMPRPDRCHYVIDMLTDEITRPPRDGRPTVIRAVQVWADPAFPDAHRGVELRDFMLMMAQRHGMATIVRFDSSRVIAILPPPVSPDGNWLEIAGVPRDEAPRNGDHA
jgi:hypothetical protein